MADPRSKFSAAEARRIAKVSQRQLDYWDQVGLVRPAGERKRGKGIARRYSYTDLVKLVVVKRLRDAGLSLQKIRKSVSLLKRRNASRDPLLHEVLITDGVRLHRLTRDPSAVEEVLNSGQLAFTVVHLGRVEATVRQLIPLRPARKMAK